MNPSQATAPRRGEIWMANTGGKKHALVIVSLDTRNVSDRANTVLAVPFGSAGRSGPTVIVMQPGETGLPVISFLKAHYIQLVQKADLIERLPRRLSNAQIKNLIAAVNRAIDPDAPFEQS